MRGIATDSERFGRMYFEAGDGSDYADDDPYRNIPTGTGIDDIRRQIRQHGSITPMPVIGAGDLARR